MKSDIRKLKKPVPIPIFCDNENSQQSNSCRKIKIKPVPLICRPTEATTESPRSTISDSRVEEEEKENVAPVGGSYSTKKVPTNGVLVPSQNILYAPLEIQEKVLDDDEQEEEEATEVEEQKFTLEQNVQHRAAQFNKINMDQTSNPNQTMFLPTAEDFEEMARKASTPINGRRFIPEEDENTCAVQIAFKIPLPVQPQDPQESGELKNRAMPEIHISGLDEKGMRLAEYKDIPEEQMDINPANCITSKKVEQEEKQNTISNSNNPDGASTCDNNTLPPPQNPMMVAMSPIMETSREHNYRSSSSSSSESQWHMTANNKSHWNGDNTTTGSHQPNYNHTNNAIPGVRLIKLVI